jgi:hypothetical protein
MRVPYVLVLFLFNATVSLPCGGVKAAKKKLKSMSHLDRGAIATARAPPA